MVIAAEGGHPTLRSSSPQDTTHPQLKEMIMKYRDTRAPLVIAAATLAALASLGMASAAQAQQMGRDGWNFNGRNKSMAAQFDFTRRMQQDSTAAGVAAFQQYVTTYNSSSTSIANMNQINQSLSNGSTGTVTNGTHQDSNGNQNSNASTDVTFDNSVELNKTTNNTNSNQNHH